MLRHGLEKLFNFETMRHSFPDPIGLGSEQGLILVIAAEVGCAALLILGLFTRLAALPLVFTMGVAIFTHLAKGDSFASIELPLLYGIAFLALLFGGPGAPSIDRRMAVGVSEIRGKPSLAEPPRRPDSIAVPPAQEPFDISGNDPELE